MLAIACARRHPVGRPGSVEGMMAYTVGTLSFEAPAAWEAKGTAEKLTLSAPDQGAELQVSVVPSTAPTEKDCLVVADRELAKRSSRFRNVRRHETTLGGRIAVMQEADGGQGASSWHGWAYAICDGP